MGLTKHKKWDEQWTYTYDNMNVDFKRLFMHLKSYLEKNDFEIQEDLPPSVNGFNIVAGHSSLLKISKSPRLAVNIEGTPDSFECIIFANEGKKLDLTASKWKLEITQTIEKLKDSITSDIAIQPESEKTISRTLKKPLLAKRGYYEELEEILLQIVENLGKEQEIVLLRTIQTQLKTKAPKVEATTEDIEKILQILTKKGLILGLKIFPGGIKVVELTPFELTKELTTILKLAEKQEYTTVEEVVRKTGWTVAKAQQALDRLENLGVTRKVDDYATGTRWYIPN